MRAGHQPKNKGLFSPHFLSHAPKTLRRSALFAQRRGRLALHTAHHTRGLPIL